MRNSFFIGLVILVVIFGCKKDYTSNKAEGCTHPTPTKVPKTFYNLGANPMPEVQYQQSHCGYLPLGKNNYWVFLDSMFDYQTGQFQYSVIDTLRFTKTLQTYDSIIWWVPEFSNYTTDYKGYYDRMYSTDSTLYTLSEGAFGYKQTVIWGRILVTDSVYSRPRWSDAGMFECTDLKLHSPVVVPAGTFTDCSLFVKVWNRRSWQYVYIKPGIGVLRSISKWDPSGNFIARTSTLLSYHIE
ncbi:MAG TPA: hypothetical protein PKJ94_04300 [Ferruginibacter sp.]|nr:hypothetical protein [Ferruginibacter sp.]